MNKIIIAIFTFFILFSIRSNGQIIINEIMFNPAGEEPEWVELYNYSDNDFNDSLTIADPVRQYTFYLQNFVSKTYCVLVSDTNLLKNLRQIPATAILIQTKLPGLNNDKDTLRLLNINTNLMDIFIYKGSWSDKGYSLERISPGFSADNNEALKQSIAVDSASCGRLNSISDGMPQILPDSDAVEITPNPFSPNSQNGKNICEIRLGFANENINLKITLYDMNGAKMLVLSDNPDKLVPGFHTFRWNGKNEQGYNVQAGIYALIIEYQDVKTQVQKFFKKLVVVGT